MVAAIPESDYTGLRPILEGQSQCSGGVGDKNVIPSDGVFPPDVFGFMNVQGRVACIGTQESDRFVNGFPFAGLQQGIAFEEGALEIEGSSQA